jgi:uncharacterized membrane protein YbhN (UPF0104 family)
MTNEATLDRTGTGCQVDHPDVAAKPRIRKGTGWAWARRGLLFVATGFVVRTVVAGWPEIHDAFGTLSEGSAGLVFLAIALECLWVLTLAQVYRSSLIGFGGSASFSTALRVSMAAFTLSRVLPGGGAVGALFAARGFTRAGNRAEVTLIALVSAGWVSLTSLAVLLVLGVGWGVFVGTLSANYLIVPSAVFGVLVAVGVLVAHAAKRRAWPPLVARTVDRVFGSWDAGMSRVDIQSVILDRGRPGAVAVARVFGWSAISWLLDAAALGVMFAAFGHPVGVGVLSVGFGVANLIQALPELTPGWLGVIEGSLSLTYAGMGVPAGLAVVVILGYRSISFWMPVAAGLPFAWGVWRASKRAQTAEKDI